LSELPSQHYRGGILSVLRNGTHCGATGDS
jgi:hypothetical protein